MNQTTMYTIGLILGALVVLASIACVTLLSVFNCGIGFIICAGIFTSFVSLLWFIALLEM